MGDDFNARALTNDALCILYNLRLTESGLRQLVRGGQFVDSLTQVMLRGSYDSRAYAVLLLKSMFEVAEPMEMITLRTDLFHEVVQVLHDGISPQATKAALKLLIHVCPWGRSRIKAVEAGAVSVLVEKLLESSEKRICELVFMLLEMVCQSAEGRAELLRHGAGIAIVSKKILRVSQIASERSVRILHSLARFSATPAIVQEMLEIGVAAKLCLVLQVESGRKTKEKAIEILRLHRRAWRNSPCIPASLASSYP
ncbi:hypothetical protein MLD38_015992 [Melastoma candidum]|nr:hypothetical protein MLD38_015992 [Melastoma candidum]